MSQWATGPWWSGVWVSRTPRRSLRSTSSRVWATAEPSTDQMIGAQLDALEQWIESKVYAHQSLPAGRREARGVRRPSRRRAGPRRAAADRRQPGAGRRVGCGGRTRRRWRRRRRRTEPNWYAPPFKVFDNLYWLGTRQHSSWALQTSAGIIIIDTNFAWATEPEIIEGLTTLGLNPRDIKYVVISHAHGDHDQGAAELQKRFGAKVVMGAADWDVDAAAAGDGGGRRADARHRRRTGGLEADARRHHRRHRRHAGPHARHAVVRLPRKGPGPDRDGRVFRRHVDRRLRHERRAVGRVHRLAAQDRQGGRRRRRDA